MGSRSSGNKEVQIITREGEVKIKLELDINVNVIGGEISVKAAAKDQGGGQKLEEVENNIWVIPDFSGQEKIEFGKEER